MLRQPHVLAVLLAICFAFRGANGFTMMVDGGVQECFMEDLLLNGKLQGSFEVVAGGSMTISCKITGPGGAVHYAVNEETDGSFLLLAPTEGTYRVCFDNRVDSSGKTLNFMLHDGGSAFTTQLAKKGTLSASGAGVCSCGRNKGGCVGLFVPTLFCVGSSEFTRVVDRTLGWFLPSEHVTPLEEGINELSVGVIQLQDEQRYMRARERAHRDSTLRGSVVVVSSLCLPLLLTWLSLDVCVFAFAVRRSHTPQLQRARTRESFGFLSWRRLYWCA